MGLRWEPGGTPSSDTELSYKLVQLVPSSVGLRPLSAKMAKSSTHISAHNRKIIIIAAFGSMVRMSPKRAVGLRVAGLLTRDRRHMDTAQQLSPIRSASPAGIPTLTCPQQDSPDTAAKLPM